MEIVERRFSSLRPIETGADQGPGFAPFPVEADQVSSVAEEIASVLRPAVDAVLPQAVLGLGRQGRKRDQFRVRLVVAWQQGQFNAPLAADSGHLLDSVGPISAAA